jgi:hypothetical protein
VKESLVKVALTVNSSTCRDAAHKGSEPSPDSPPAPPLAATKDKAYALPAAETDAVGCSAPVVALASWEAASPSDVTLGTTEAVGSACENSWSLTLKDQPATNTVTNAAKAKMLRLHDMKIRPALDYIT